MLVIVHRTKTIFDLGREHKYRFCRFALVYTLKVSKGAKIRNRYNQVPHLTQDTNGKVTNSQLDITNESKEVSPFPAGDLKVHINRRAQRHSKHKTEKKKHKIIHKRSTALERSVKYFIGVIYHLMSSKFHIWTTFIKLSSQFKSVV